MGSTKIVIGVDVGGTTIKAGAAAVTRRVPQVTADIREVSAAIRTPDLRLSASLVVTEQIATPRVSPPAFYDRVAELIHHVVERAGQRRELVAVGVAHPGRFLSDGRLARGTTPNLGGRPGEFDGVCPAEELHRRVAVPVFAENDAVAQMRFGLEVLLRDPTARPALLGRTVIYLGPGTGMGGGVARVGRKGAVRAITDGHLFDLQVPGYADGALTAEELFTGPAMARHVREANRGLSVPIEPATAEQVSRLLASDEASPEHRLAAQRIADRHGELLARLIQTIHAGRIVKVRVEPLSDGTVARYVDEPDRAWSAADQAAVRGVRRVILGGLVGTDRVLGGRLRARALELLRHQGLGDLEIFQIPLRSADAGILGAIQAIPT